MISQSGCFGKQKAADPIDDIKEAEEALNDIVDNATGTTQEPSAAPDLGVARLLGEYVRRVRILTWAVVAIALYLVLKEAD